MDGRGEEAVFAVNEREHPLGIAGHNDAAQSPTEGMDEVDKFLSENGNGNDDEPQKNGHVRVAHDEEHAMDKASLVEDGGDEPGFAMDTGARASSSSSEADRLRAILLYLATSCIYDGYINLVKHRNPAALLLSVPCDSLAITVLAVAVRLYASRVKLSSTTFSNAVEDSFSILPSYRWRQTLRVGISFLASSSTYLLATLWLDMSIRLSIFSYASPLLLLLAPTASSVVSAPLSAAETTFAMLVPAFFGITLSNIVVSTSALLSAVVLPLTEAIKLASVCKHFGESPYALEAGVLVSYAPMNFLLSCMLWLPVAIYSRAFKPVTFTAPFYLIIGAVLSAAQQYTTMGAVTTLEAPVTIALVFLLRPCISLFLGGSFGNSQLWMLSLFVILASTMVLSDLRRWVGRFSSLHASAQTALSSFVIETDRRSMRLAGGLTLFPVIFWVLQCLAGPRALNFGWRHGLVNAADSPHTLDVVIAYYNEPLEGLGMLMDEIKSRVWYRNEDIRWIMYLKNETGDAMALQAATGVHQIIKIPNFGREGGTYLKHIVRNYNATVDPSLRRDGALGLAHHTLFVQPHLAWDWIARKRLDALRENTGFMALGPYITMDCAHDMAGNGDFDRYPHVYAIFRETFCPPTHQLASYAAQFFASRKRILENPYSKYKGLDDLLEAPAGHWLHEENSWWKYHGDPGPTNPFLGHLLERFWTVMFNCGDPAIAEACQGDAEGDPNKCQCFD